jgi:hypothetical protein
MHGGRTKRKKRENFHIHGGILPNRAPETKPTATATTFPRNICATEYSRHRHNAFLL